jgi:glycosyltransferase involved in cell wall biosynthesis
VSVAGQSSVRPHHIIQDAGSSDSTVEVLRSHEQVDWRSEPDEGQSDALNRAIQRASGDWIAWINADEFYLPGGLCKLIEIGEKSDVDVVYGDALFVDEQGRFMRLLPQHQFSSRILEWYGPFISSCACVFRRGVLGAQPWDVSLRRIMDWDLYLRLASEGARFAYVPFPVGAFRVHPGRVTAQFNAQGWAEHALVGGRYRLPGASARRRGQALHRWYKLKSGAYWRQIKTRALVGQDLRWFDNAEAKRNCEQLLLLTGSESEFLSN